MDLLKTIGRVAILSIFFFSLMFFGVSATKQAKVTKKMKEPNFLKKIQVLEKVDYNWSLKTLDGQVFDLERARGRVVLINIWATWCPPCVMEMPGFQRLYDKLKNEIVFVFASYEEAEVLSGFLKKNNYTFPVYIFKTLPSFYENQGIPVTFVISQEGKIVYKEVGGPIAWDTKKTVNFLRSLKK